MKHTSTIQMPSITFTLENKTPKSDMESMREWSTVKTHFETAEKAREYIERNGVHPDRVYRIVPVVSDSYTKLALY